LTLESTEKYKNHNKFDVHTVQHCELTVNSLIVFPVQCCVKGYQVSFTSRKEKKIYYYENWFRHKKLHTHHNCTL